ncbi:histidine-tRNA ligase [Medicago truncatula]|uniref:Histidine-tRNA ligase n=1 Tax=Medicago truncatula TaxID=3880 RepID=A0A072VF76_MEDTR|nr:histidine-tRNA ligase [Medicago truncatula]
MGILDSSGIEALNCLSCCITIEKILLRVGNIFINKIWEQIRSKASLTPIKLNHRKLLDGMMQICGVHPEKFRTTCSSIDKLDKKSFKHIRKEMVEEKGLTSETADRIGTFTNEKGHSLTLLRRLKQEGSAFLENAGSVIFDLSLARGLDYYTGVIFEAVLKGGAQVGSIAAGGRYDNLIGMFGVKKNGSNKEVPAVGLSLGIERVFAILMEQHQNQMCPTICDQILGSVDVSNMDISTFVLRVPTKYSTESSATPAMLIQLSLHLLSSQVRYEDFPRWSQRNPNPCFTALVAHISNSSACLYQSFALGPWAIDFGASDHVTW